MRRAQLSRPAILSVGSLLLLLAGTDAAQAYIDPGTGGILLQILAAVGAAFLFLFNRMHTRVRNLFSFGRRKKSAQDSEEK